MDIIGPLTPSVFRYCVNGAERRPLLLSTKSSMNFSIDVCISLFLLGSRMSHKKAQALFTQGPVSAIVALKDTSPDSIFTPPSFGQNTSGTTAFVLERSNRGDPQMQVILSTQSPMISVPSLSKL